VLCLYVLSDQVTCDQNEDAEVPEKKRIARNFDCHEMVRKGSLLSRVSLVADGKERDLEVDAEQSPHFEALVLWAVYETDFHWMMMEYLDAETFAQFLESLMAKVACLAAAALLGRPVAASLEFEKVLEMREKTGIFEELKAEFE